MPLVTSSKIVPFDAKTYRPLRRNVPMFKPARPKTRSNFYTSEMQRHRPAQIDPYEFPTGSLGDLGDIGIPAIDQFLAQTSAKLATATTALKVTAVCSAIAAAAGLLLLADRRR